MVKIMLDPGHGGKEPGAVGNDLMEKDINLSLSKLVFNKLSAYDAQVILSRTTDNYVGLVERYNQANQLGTDYFCSLHTNAGGGTGFESYVYTYATAAAEKYRTVIHDKVAAYYKLKNFADRGKKSANFAVLRETKMPAVLLENLFIDNPGDAVKLKDLSFLDGLAAVISQGLAAALQIPLKPTESPQPTSTPWDPAGEIAKLKKDGLIKNDHQPEAMVTWGEMAAVINRLRGKS